MFFMYYICDNHHEETGLPSTCCAVLHVYAYPVDMNHPKTRNLEGKLQRLIVIVANVGQILFHSVLYFPKI